MSARLALEVRPGRLAVCRFGPDEPLPAWVFHEDARFYCVMRTPEELSVLCPEDDLPPSLGARAERGFRALRVSGTLPFGAVGVLARLTAPLAAAGIPVFVVSSYDTDYLLVREERLEDATRALAAVATIG